MKGNQKIKNILIDAKVPKDLRDTIPLILFDNEVAWILGIKKLVINLKSLKILKHF